MNRQTQLKEKKEAKRRASLKAKRDDYAYRQTIVQSNQKSRAEGFQEGFRQGLEEVLQKVRAEMLEHISASGKFTIPEMAKMTGLDEAYIRELLK